MIRKIVFFFILSLTSIFSQDPNWSSFLTFPQYPSPYFSDWERNPNIGTLNINYIGSASVEFYFEVVINIDGYGDAIIGRTAKREYLSGPVSEILTFSDLSDWESTKVNSDLQNVVLQTGKLPEANYSICVTTHALNGDLLTDACTDFEIALPNPPQLISPEDEGSIKIAQPTFMWNAVSTPPTIDVFYQVKIVEILNGQSPFRAIESNVPVVEAEVASENLYIYRLDDYPLEQNHTYAWQIQATNDEGIPIATNNGSSEIWQFTFGSPAGELGLDTLMLIEDFAYLIDLENLEITDNSATLQLNGSCNMLIKSSEGIDKYIDVSAQNLMLQKDSYDNPVFLGGTILGALGENIFSKDITGDFFKPTELEFIPPNLTIAGDFYLGENVDVPLAGKLNYNNGELSGDISIISDGTNPLFSYGDESFKMNITNILLSYPSMDATLEGGLSLFGNSSSCSVNDIQLNKKGEYSVTVDCNINQEIALIKDSNIFNLNVNSVNGNISGSFLTGETDYEIILDGGLSFNVNEENNFSADVELQLKPNDFQLISFDPSGEVEIPTLDLGWVKWGMKNIDLKKLAYTKGNWNFDLAMDIDLSFPNFDFGDYKIPTLSGISFNPKGFNFPKIDINNFSIPNIDFAGFGLELYGVHIPKFNFDLASWTPGSIAKMGFNFDMKFSMPNLPNGTDDDFKFPKWDFKGASIFDGNFFFNLPSINLPDVGFPDGINIPMPNANGLSFNVTSFGGKLNTNYNGSLMDFLPDVNIGGSLTLPDALQCEDGETHKIDASVKLNGNGSISGVIENIIPKCPINIGLASLYMKKSKVEFKLEEDDQKIILDGSAGIKFTKDPNQDEVGEIAVTYEVLGNELIKAEGTIKEDFQWDLPSVSPALKFEIAEAILHDKKITIDGRSEMKLSGETMGVTFDNFTFDLNDYEVKSGQIIFDQPFAFSVTGLENSEINFAAIKKGEIPKVENFLYFEIPTKVILDKNGFSLVGESKAIINFQGKSLGDLVNEGTESESKGKLGNSLGGKTAEAGGLSAKFSDDFSFSLSPFKVKSGRCDVLFEGDELAYINSNGFAPNANYFLNKIIPEKIPLPRLDIAYLKIKEADQFLVDYTKEENGYRVSTKENNPVELVFPGLQFDSPMPPKVLVEFSLFYNYSKEEITNGEINVVIPDESLDDFDLAKIGIPYQVRSIFYGSNNGDYEFKLDGNLKMFNAELEALNQVELPSISITKNGKLKGNFNYDLNKTIAMVPNSDKLNFIVNKITGNFDVDILAMDIDFDLTLDSDIKFKVSEEKEWGVWTKLNATPSGFNFIDSRIDADIEDIALDNLTLGINDLSLPSLSYIDSANIGWDFEFQMALDISFPNFDFGISIPKDRGITLTKSGFHFPEIALNDLPDSLKFEFQGFEFVPLNFRIPSLTYNWFDPLNVESDWNFGFDFAINFPNVEFNTGEAIKTANLIMNDVSFNNGVLSGNFNYPSITPGSYGLAFGGVSFDVLGINGKLFNNDGVQGIDFGFKGNLKMPNYSACSGQSETSNDISNTELKFNSKGMLSGKINNFVPKCPIDIGFGKFRVSDASIEFAINEDKQEVNLDMSGSLKFPTGEVDSATASGSLGVELVSGNIYSGEVRIDEQFTFSIPFEKPLFKFNVNSAVLNKRGLEIDGNSQLKIDNNRFVQVDFNRFLFNPFKMEVKSGSITVHDSIAVKLAIKNGGIDYEIVPYNFVLNENKMAKIGFAAGATIDSSGLSVSGDANAAFKWADSLNFAGLSAKFSDDYKMEFKPFGVKSGKVDVFYDSDLVATYDKNGIHPGNILGQVEIPDIIPLPTLEIASLKIKENGEFLVETTNSDSGMVLRTIDDRTIKLSIPALAKNGNIPVFNVKLNATLNTTTWEFVGGEIELLLSEGETSLYNLEENFGIPLDITKLRYGKDKNGEYGLTANTNFRLPKALGDFPVSIDDLAILANGFEGSVSLGNFSTISQISDSTLYKASIGNSLDITLEGISAEFGENKAFEFSGKLIPKMFISENEEGDADTSVIHYSSSWDSESSKFIFAIDMPEDKSLDLGIAEIKPTKIGNNPSVQLEISDEELAIILNGQLLVDNFTKQSDDPFSIDFENMKISSSGFSVDNISIDEANAIQFKLFNSAFRIFDKAATATSAASDAISFNFDSAEKVLSMTLSGDLEFFDKKIAFQNFSFNTKGEFSFDEVDFLENDLEIVPKFLSLTQIKLNENLLSVYGKAQLPKPADTTSFNFNFSIAANGDITGEIENGEIVLLNEFASGYSEANDISKVDFWVGEFDAKYLSLDLDFATIRNSKVKMIANLDIGDSRIEIGKNGIGGISPGFTVDFNGATKWDNITVPEEINVDWEMLKFNSSVTLGGGSDFSINLTGNFGLDFSGVEGGVNFEELKVTPTGVSNFGESIIGGDLTVVNVFSVTVDSIGFSADPSNITIDGEEILVDNYFQLAGSFDIANGTFNGGVDNFYTYSIDGNRTLAIDNAYVEMSGVFSANLSMMYAGGDNPKLTVGGSGEIVGLFEGRFTGALADNSFGFFVAVGSETGIPIGPVVLTEFGGGFFYNPTKQDIDAVKVAAGLADGGKAKNKIKMQSASNPSFAAFLYAQMVLVDDAVISGKILLTLTGTRFNLDGQVVILGMDNSMYGNIDLGVDLTNGNLNGNIDVYLDVDPLLTGGLDDKGKTGNLSFYVYGSDKWGVFGSAKIGVIFDFFEVQSKFFVIPEGFLVRFSSDYDFDLYILEVGAGFEAQLWYLQNVSWGAYGKVYVHLDAMFASASGHLMFALLGGNTSPSLYGEGHVEASCCGWDFEGTAWVKVNEDGIDGDTGHNSEMEALIKEAQDLCDGITKQAEALKDVIVNTPPPPIIISNKALIAAHTNLVKHGRNYHWSSDETAKENARAVYAEMKKTELNYIKRTVNSAHYYYEAPQNERDFIYGMIQRYTLAFIPDEYDFNSNISEIERITNGYNSTASTVIEKLNFVLNDIDSYSLSDFSDTLQGNPLDLSNLNEPEIPTLDVTNENGNGPEINQPHFGFDKSISDNNSEKASEFSDNVNAYDEYVQTQISNINTNIAKLSMALSSWGGPEKLSEKYGSLNKEISIMFAFKYWKDKQLYYWGEDNIASLPSESTVRTMMENKARRIMNTPNLGWQALRDLQANRYRVLNTLTDSTIANPEGIIASWNASHNNTAALIEQSTQSGLELWYNIHKLGFEYLADNMKTIVNSDVTTKNEVIDVIRSNQVLLTEKMDDLYASLSELYELKYDLLEYYIKWKKLKNLNVDSFLEQQNRIANRMKLPKINSLKVKNADFGIYAKSIVSWSNSDNNIPVKYLIDYSQKNIETKGLQAIGGKKSFSLYHLPKIDETDIGEVSFIVTGRTPIGYKFANTISYRPEWSNEREYNSSVNSVVVAENGTDTTPPIITSGLVFPEGFEKQTIDGSSSQSKYYISSQNVPKISWSAYDDESGIKEYKYKFVEVTHPENGGSSSNMNTPNISEKRAPSLTTIQNPIPSNSFCDVDNSINTVIPVTNINGRDNVTLNTVTFTNGNAYKLVVKAVNSKGLVSASCAGLNEFIIVDDTPPGDITTISETGSNVEYLSSNPKYFAPEDFPEPTESNSNLVVFSLLENQFANHSISWGSTTDEESGIERYEYRVVNKNNPSSATGWISNGKNRSVNLKNSSMFLSQFGDNRGVVDILTYLDTFVVDVRAVNHANVHGASIKTSFRPIDITRPSAPEISLVYNSMGKGMIMFKKFATDGETGIDHYEFVQFSGNNINWDNATTINLNQIIGNNKVYFMSENSLQTRKYIAVRAVNSQGTYGDYCYSGLYYKDNTIPLKPNVVLSRIVGDIKIDVSNLSDSESGIKRIRYQLYKQDPGTTINSFGIPVEKPWVLAKDWTNVSVSGNEKIIRLDYSAYSDIGINNTHKVRVVVKAENNVSLLSAPATSDYIMDKYRPSTPGLSINSGNNEIELSFSNIHDSDAGVGRIEYKIYKRISGTGPANVIITVENQWGMEFTSQEPNGDFASYTGWRDNGVNLTATHLYSDNSGNQSGNSNTQTTGIGIVEPTLLSQAQVNNSLRAGDVIKVEVRVIDKWGNISEITEQAIELN